MRAFRLPMQRHSILVRIMTSLAVCSSLGNDISIIVDRLSHETLVAWNVSALRVSVNESVSVLPLTVTSVLALLKDLSRVLTVVDCVEHDLGIVAVCVGSCAESLCVWNDSSVFSHKGTVWRIVDPRASQSQPFGGAKVVHATEGEVAFVVAGTRACN